MTSDGDHDRRRALRRSPVPGEPVARVRLRTGPELSVVDVSDAGALLTGATRLLPNTRVDLHVIGRTGRVLVRARVVRAFVSEMKADSIQYRVAVSFDAPVDTSPAGYSFPLGPEGAAAVEGSAYPERPEDASVSF